MKEEKNNMNTGLDFIKVGIGALLVVLFVSAIVFFGGRGLGFFNSASEGISTVEKQANEMEFTALEFTEVNGATVISKIREYENEAGSLIVQVTTHTGGTDQYVSTGTVAASTYAVSGTLTAAANFSQSLQNAMDDTNTNYINKVAMFDVKLGKDSNGVIRALVFEQQ